MENNMIKKFGEKGHEEIKRLLDKPEKKKQILHEQKDLLILKKERNLALENLLLRRRLRLKS
jgi:hypothetical protein